MIAREFIIEKKLFLRRKLTILQHKLRVVMKHGLEIGYEEWYKKYGASEINFYIK